MEENYFEPGVEELLKVVTLSKISRSYLHNMYTAVGCISSFSNLVSVLCILLEKNIFVLILFSIRITSHICTHATFKRLILSDLSEELYRFHKISIQKLCYHLSYYFEIHSFMSIKKPSSKLSAPLVIRNKSRVINIP